MKLRYLCMLLAVTVVWGLDPLINRYLYKYYSAAVLCTLATLASALVFLFLERKRLKKPDRRYFTVALPISLINSLACVLQRIGLQYTSPARYAFLEHLSIVSVPIVLFAVCKKRPRVPQLLCALLCLGGCLLLAGEGVLEGEVGVGDVLCALAGLMLGAAIVFTSEYTEGLDIRLFMTVHMCTYFLTSLALTLGLHLIPVGGAPIERIVFTLSPLPLLGALLFGLLTVGLCWLMRNEATRHLPPALVSVIAPFAAPITAVISVLTGQESLTPSLILASLLILAAAILSGLSERPKEKPLVPQAPRSLS